LPRKRKGAKLKNASTQRLSVSHNPSTIARKPSASSVCMCGGCMTCIGLCPYQAIRFVTEAGVARVNEALCQGCGTCVAACPAAAITGAGFTDAQILAELRGMLAPVG